MKPSEIISGNDPNKNFSKKVQENVHVTKLPLVMLRLLLFLSSFLHMLVFACLDKSFPYKMPMHGKYGWRSGMSDGLFLPIYPPRSMRVVLGFDDL